MRKSLLTLLSLLLATPGYAATIHTGDNGLSTPAAAAVATRASLGVQDPCYLIGSEDGILSLGTNRGQWLAPPGGFTVTAVYAWSDTVAGTTLPQFDINALGVGTILSTKITIDVLEQGGGSFTNTWITPTTVAVISYATLVAGQPLYYDTDTIDDGTASNIHLYVCGH